METLKIQSVDELTHSGSLTVGVVFNGERHIDFVLRPANILDNLFSIEQCGLIPERELAKKDELRPADVVHNMRTNTAMLSRQILSLGTIPRDVIDNDFLLKNLDPLDLDTLYEANDALKKKRLDLPLAGSTSTVAPQ